MYVSCNGQIFRTEAECIRYHKYIEHWIETYWFLYTKFPNLYTIKELNEKISSLESKREDWRKNENNYLYYCGNIYALKSVRKRLLKLNRTEM